MKHGLIVFISFFIASLTGAAEYKVFLDKTNTASKTEKTDNRVQLNPAIKSAQSGDELLFDNQEGKTYRIQIENKTKHENGDISLIGFVDSDSQRVVITQGSSASSGLINTADGQYKITIRNNRSYLVSPDQIKTYIAAGTNNDEVWPDPIKNNKSSKALSKVVTANAAPAGVAEIDVLILYTSDLITSLGGVSAVKTRINQLISLTNQAYIDSEMAMQLNLVHSQHINADNDSSSLDALVAMQSGTGIFSTVAALRSSKGADLVILLRDFKALHNGSCGIAYVLGDIGSGTMPNSNKYHAFSIVQNGQYTEGDKINFCTDYSLSHEVGHNFGFTHDRDHSSNPGLFDFSYGHDVAGTFSTIMSYENSISPNTQQLGIFSNPNINCSGLPCGIPDGQANSADNAKSGNLVRHDLANFYPTAIDPSTLISIIQLLLLN